MFNKSLKDKFLLYLAYVCVCVCVYVLSLELVQNWKSGREELH